MVDITIVFMEVINQQLGPSCTNHQLHQLHQVPLCPASYVDCGRCSCVAESTCQFCSDEATTATTTRATTVATTVATTTTTTVATTGAVPWEDCGDHRKKCGKVGVY